MAALIEDQGMIHSFYMMTHTTCDSIPRTLVHSSGLCQHLTHKWHTAICEEKYTYNNKKEIINKLIKNFILEMTAIEYNLNTENMWYFEKLIFTF